MILVFTGNGKGKTTAAIGQGIRAVGQGKNVFMIQFIKSKKWPTGEEKTIKELSPQFTLLKGGEGFVGIMGDKLPREVHEKAARETLKIAKEEMFSKKWNLVILDEVNVALSLNLILLKDVLDILKNLPKDLDIILTGRDAPKEIIETADLITEFREIKHPFQKGVFAKIGLEY